MKKLINIPFWLYKNLISPWLGVNCRFQPSCSEYCRDALHKHGVFKGLLLGIYRLLRCNPWGGSGYDPVPEKKDKQN